MFLRGYAFLVCGKICLTNHVFPFSHLLPLENPQTPTIPKNRPTIMNYPIHHCTKQIQSHLFSLEAFILFFFANNKQQFDWKKIEILLLSRWKITVQRGELEASSSQGRCRSKVWLVAIKCTFKLNGKVDLWVILSKRKCRDAMFVFWNKAVEYQIETKTNSSNIECSSKGD